MTETRAWVGTKQVLASGTLIIAPTDFYVTVYIDEHPLSIFFIHSEAAPVANHDHPNPGALRVTVTGKLTPSGSWWNLTNVTTWDGKFVHLTMYVVALSEPVVFRQVTYTLIQSDAAL